MGKDSKEKKGKTIRAPNVIKEKVGSGGFRLEDIKKAQIAIEENQIDFKPAAIKLLNKLDNVLVDIKSGQVKREDAFDKIIGIAMQLKSQGAMFHYPLVTEISYILVTFLEKISRFDENVIEVIEAHKISLEKVISNEIKSDLNVEISKQFSKELTNVCDRYFKKLKEEKV